MEKIEEHRVTAQVQKEEMALRRKLKNASGLQRKV